MKFPIFLISFLLFALSGFPQLSYEKRLEIDLKDGYEEEDLLAFGEKGFMIRSRSARFFDEDTEWRYELFDTNLESLDTKSVLLNRKYYLDETYNTESRSHTLYKDNQENYAIVSIDVDDLEMDKVQGTLPKNAWIKDMVVMGDYAFFDASIKKQSLLVSINWKTGKTNFIPIELHGLKPKNVFIRNFQVLEQANEVLVYVKAVISKNSSEVHILRLNDEGKKEDSFILNEDLNKNLISISASRIDEGNYIFSGTYSSASNATSEGLFVCQRVGQEIEFINFHEFLDLKDFLSYLPERGQKKIKRKQKRKQGRGKDFVIDYRIIDHEMKKLDDGYLFLGEAYYPTYRSEPQSTTTFVNGVATTSTIYVSEFDGYQYTHAIIAKFDFDGNLDWNNSFEMWPAYKPYFPKKFISVAEENKELINMVFASRNRIYSKSVHYEEGEEINSEESDEIETGVEGDKSKRTYSNIDYWYGNYFIAHGNQVIKNKENEEVKKKRKVYFISKVAY